MQADARRVVSLIFADSSRTTLSTGRDFVLAHIALRSLLMGEETTWIPSDQLGALSSYMASVTGFAGTLQHCAPDALKFFLDGGFFCVEVGKERRMFSASLDLWDCRMELLKPEYQPGRAAA